MPYETSMERNDKARSGVALGGLGTGAFELHEDGIFRNWNIFNNYPLGTGEPLEWAEDSMLFFILRYEVEGEYPKMKILQVTEGYDVGAIRNHYYEFPWLEGVDRIDYEARFPFVNVKFTDAEMPLEVEMEAFSPFIPHDVKNSALPAAIFNFRLSSRIDRPVHVMLAASMRNAVGYDVEEKYHVTNVIDREGYRLFELTEGGMDQTHSSFGSQAMASLHPGSGYYTGWEVHHPYYEVLIRNRELPDYDDTAGRNSEEEETGELRAVCDLYATIGRSARLEPGQELEHSFVAGWHFANLYNRERTHVEGHYYANHFESAPEVVDYVVEHMEDLRTRSLRFTRDFFDSSAPAFVLDQVNSQLNTFFTSSWLNREGKFGILEGLAPDHSYGPLATVDVSLYGAMAVSALFPELHKSMMKAHRDLQAPSGEVGHGIGKDFRMTDVQETVTGRIDLPSQYVILALRGFFWTGDRDYLEDMWPSVKAALDYVLRERDPDGDSIPDMQGAMCTYDNFKMWGASSYVGSLWLSALSQAVEAAEVLDDSEAAQKYADVLQDARETFVHKLWNGRYFRLYDDSEGETGESDEGCLTDQVIGQWTNDLIGAEDILDRPKLKSALRTICDMSRQPWGLVNCRWPDDEFLHPVPEDCWHDQSNTCWSGVELAFASFLLYEDMVEEALAVIRNVDARYRKWGLYWDHIEFGGHYYRPMSAWGIINGLLGLAVRDEEYVFDPKLPDGDLRLFFSFGDGIAHYRRELSEEAERLGIEVHTGRLQCGRLEFTLTKPDCSEAVVECGGLVVAGDRCAAEFSEGRLILTFSEPLTVEAGEALEATVR